MRMPRTTEVFTPNATPTITTVIRESIWEDLELNLEIHGNYISVLGTTKLGKSTLIKSQIKNAPFSVYIPGQTLIDGPSALWRTLANELRIPVSTTTGRASSDKSKWGFMGRLGVSLPSIFSVAGEASTGGEHETSKTSQETHETDIPSAVSEAIGIIASASVADGKTPPVVAIDDFHFITDVNVRRSLLQALRPLTDLKLVVVLASLPGREVDPAFKETNISGRRQHIPVPTWKTDELEEIARAGFKTLNVRATDAVIEYLADESYGSPQIMQTLCYMLCRIVNKIKADQPNIVDLKEPNDWDDFFRRIKDDDSVEWLRTLGSGPTPRNPRNQATLADGRLLDGYQLILWAVHQLGTPEEVKWSEVRTQVAKMLGINVSDLGPYALEAKAKNMNTIASRDMRKALSTAGSGGSASHATDEESLEESAFSREEIDLANLIPQPVFEFTGDTASNRMIRILDPLLAYTMNWHPEVFATPA